MEKLGLSPGQQTDVSEVKAKTLLNRTQAGMKVALKYWRSNNPIKSTFRALLLILLSLLKGDVAIQVCKYLYNKCKFIGQYSHPTKLGPNCLNNRGFNLIDALALTGHMHVINYLASWQFWCMRKTNVESMKPLTSVEHCTQSSCSPLMLIRSLNLFHQNFFLYSILVCLVEYVYTFPYFIYSRLLKSSLL